MKQTFFVFIISPLLCFKKQTISRCSKPIYHFCKNQLSKYAPNIFVTLAVAVTEESPFCIICFKYEMINNVYYGK